MLKSVLLKVLYIAAILAVISAGNYFFDEELQDSTSVTAPANANQSKPASAVSCQANEEETYE